jgi:hypothetical protein
LSGSSAGAGSMAVAQAEVHLPPRAL